MTTSANVKQSAEVGDSCTFEPVGREKKLEMCCCESTCLLGRGAYGRVFKGKWNEENEEGVTTIDAAVKQPTAGPHHIEYEITALVKANGHRNILRFYGEIQVRIPPSR